MANYIQNAAKEAKQFGTAWLKTWQASGEVGPGTDARASNLSKKKDKAGGQLLGAVLQGRRYNDTTGKQIKASPANARKMAPKKPMPKPKAK